MRYFRLGLIMIVVILLTWALTTGNPSLESENEPQLVEFPGLSAGFSPSAALQDQLDRVAQAALEERWASALYEVERLENMWDSWQPPSSITLEITRGIDNHLQTIHYNVWGRDKQGVLNSARKLTELISSL